MIENYSQDQHFDPVDVTESFWQKNGPSFENCTFSNCNFQKMNLADLKFYDCRFTHCDFSLSQVPGTIFQGVDFIDCKLSGILFDQCNPFALELRFKGSKLDHSSFYGLKLNQALFQDCSLKGVDFTNAQLKEASFKGSDLAEVKFEQTNLEKADFRTAIHFVIQPDNNKIKGAIFSMDGLPGLLAAYKIKIEA